MKRRKKRTRNHMYTVAIATMLFSPILFATGLGLAAHIVARVQSKPANKWAHISETI